MCFLIFPTFKAWGGYSKAAAKQRMGDFNSQDLANAAWAFARASQGDVSIFAALATAAEQRMGDFNSQELANVGSTLYGGSTSLSPGNVRTLVATAEVL